jgi:hypothetical protein
MNLDTRGSMRMGAPAAAAWFSNIAGSHTADLPIEYRVVDCSRL